MCNNCAQLQSTLAERDRTIVRLRTVLRDAATQLIDMTPESLEPGHLGPCTPESGCDYQCVINAGIAERNRVRHQIQKALAGTVQVPDEKDQTIARLTEENDDAYLQRNHVVAALARCFPSGVRKTNIEGWSADWHGCVYIDLPAGQISYHYHDSQAGLFHGLPAYEKPYDGHTKQQVHDRLSSANVIAIIARLREMLERWGVVTEDTQP